MKFVCNIIACVFLAATTNIACATNNPVSIKWMDELQGKLSGFGLSLDQSSMEKATLLAAVQTLDSKAMIISTQEWSAIRQLREGLGYQTGIQLGMTNGLPVIASIQTGAPPETAELKTGDIITGIGTQLFEKISLPQALEFLSATDAAPVAIRYVRHHATNTVNVSRALLQYPAIEVVELLPNNIGYIKINGIYPGSGRDVVSRIRAWSENSRDGIILDLRGAGGADNNAVMQIAALFSMSGQFLFAYRDFNHQDIEVFKATEGNPVTLPVMVLIDHNTYGASEVLAATLNGSTRNVLLIGESTSGDFNLREAVELDNQLIYMATRVLNTADGIRYTGQFKLEPSVVIEAQSRDTRDYEPPVNLLDHRQILDVEERDIAARRRVRGDGVLERAIDIIIGLKSLNKAAGTVSSPDVL
jgi:C-terminal peptidase prc